MSFKVLCQNSFNHLETHHIFLVWRIWLTLFVWMWVLYEYTITTKSGRNIDIISEVSYKGSFVAVCTFKSRCNNFVMMSYAGITIRPSSIYFHISTIHNFFHLLLLDPFYWTYRWISYLFWSGLFIQVLSLDIQHIT